MTPLHNDGLGLEPPAPDAAVEATAAVAPQAALHKHPPNYRAGGDRASSPTSVRFTPA
jgi:hypothetical protein